ncbi:DUF6233 domain-containing protein [Streptomyces sp. 8N114]|uniref:DUF6233 domain-containing protein n=1 Tax=Streptomyces sp. 8N114 TaxID=3457419 RepID=UPI003FD2C2A6
MNGGLSKGSSLWTNGQRETPSITWPRTRGPFVWAGVRRGGRVSAPPAASGARSSPRSRGEGPASHTRGSRGAGPWVSVHCGGGEAGCGTPCSVHPAFRTRIQFREWRYRTGRQRALGPCPSSRRAGVGHGSGAARAPPRRLLVVRLCGSPLRAQRRHPQPRGHDGSDAGHCPRREHRPDSRRAIRRRAHRRSRERPPVAGRARSGSGQRGPSWVVHHRNCWQTRSGAWRQHLVTTQEARRMLTAPGARVCDVCRPDLTLASPTP